MDQQRMGFDEQYRIEHRHKDGSWEPMMEQRSHHNVAEHDVERAWSRMRIFKCTTCPETATIVPGDEGGAIEGR
jgi:hypothetical protein